MRTLRLSLVGTIIVVLLGGLGAAPAALMSQADESTATWVTGTSTIGEMREPETFIEGELVRGMGFTSTVEWSDPRLPAAMTTIANIDEHPPLVGHLDVRGGQANAPHLLVGSGQPAEYSKS